MKLSIALPLLPFASAGLVQGPHYPVAGNSTLPGTAGTGTAPGTAASTGYYPVAGNSTLSGTAGTGTAPGTAASTGYYPVAGNSTLSGTAGTGTAPGTAASTGFYPKPTTANGFHPKGIPLSNHKSKSTVITRSFTTITYVEATTWPPCVSTISVTNSKGETVKSLTRVQEHSTKALEGRGGTLIYDFTDGNACTTVTCE